MRSLINPWFAILGLRTNKLRSALTVLGVVIGVGAVIMIVSLGNGLRRSTQLEMEAWSSGTIEVRPQWGMMYAIEYIAVQKEIVVEGGGRVPIGPEPPPGPQQMPSLALEDAQALRMLATSVTGVVPQLEAYGQMIYQGQYMPSGEIVGVLQEYLTVYRRELKYGRFFNAEDQATAAPVMVIEELLSNAVFGSGVNPVGQVLHVVMQNVPQNYMVIGVLAKRRGIQGIPPRSALVPLRTAQLRLSEGQKDRVSLIAARVDSRVPAERRYAVAEINTILRARRALAPGVPEDYYVQDTLEWSEGQVQIIRTMTLVLSLIAGISLIVGSIGLMNIMMVGVAERTWEIGLRRALGAQKPDILMQFLSEGVALALTGGVGGLVLGLAGSYAGSRMIQQLRGLATVTADVFGIALGVSLLVGIVASIYPAWQAALLQPTAALRRG